MRSISTDRFVEYRLEASERPKAYYEYYVSGTGEFPFDMLRHDSAWPASGADAAKLERWEEAYRSRSVRSIKLRSYREPTIDRWRSFTWSVGIENLEAKP